MHLYPTSNNESERVKELYSYHILDSGFEKEFDDLVGLAATMLQAPIAAISFINETRQWYKAQRGMTVCEVGRDASVCNYTILQDEIMEVENLKQDERFSHFQFVANDPCYRHYAGIPLVTKNGFKIGVFFIVDVKPRTLSKEESLALKMFAQQTMKQVELRLQNLQLEKQNQQQRYLSSTLSHDIKTPLSNIKAILSMQQDDANFLTQSESANINAMMTKQVDNAINMLDNITKWSRLQTYKKGNEVELTNLRRLASEVIEEIEADTKKNLMVNAISSDINVLTDTEGVRFVLRNLLTNANKFTSNGCISVSYENKECKDYIYVTDSGMGMNKEQVENLNKNKPIGSSSGTNNEKGNGVGIGLVHDYIINKGGSLFFQSEKGKGTRASFCL